MAERKGKFEKAVKKAWMNVKFVTKKGSEDVLVESIETERLPHEEIEIIPIGDSHIGDKNVDLALLKQMVDYIKNTPEAYCILNGDILDMALKSSVSNVYNQAASPTQQMLAAVELFKPIKDKILLVTRGNHEYRADKDADMNPLFGFTQALGIQDKYVGDNWNLRVKNSKGKVLSIFGSHGSGIKGGDGPSITRSILKYIRKSFHLFDWYLFSHKHVPGHYEEEVTATYNNGERKTKTVVIDMLAAFIRNGGYGSFYNFPLTNTIHRIFRWKWKGNNPAVEVKDFLPQIIEKEKKPSRAQILKEREEKLNKKEEKLNSKAARLAAKEKELKEKEKQLNSKGVR